MRDEIQARRKLALRKNFFFASFLLISVHHSPSLAVRPDQESVARVSAERSAQGLSRLADGPAGSDVVARDPELKKHLVFERLKNSIEFYGPVENREQIESCFGLLHLRQVESLLSQRGSRRVLKQVRMVAPAAMLVSLRSVLRNDGRAERILLIDTGLTPGPASSDALMRLFESEPNSLAGVTWVRCENTATSGIITGSNRGGRGD